MSGMQFEILAIAVLTAVACALAGVFLVLRRLAMLSDAISHAILPGIVVAFFLTGDLNSPLLLVAAAATGVVAVALIEALSRTGLVGEDAAIGLVFPALFALSLQHDDPEHGHSVAVLKTMSPRGVDVEGALEALELRGLARATAGGLWAPTEGGRAAARQVLEQGEGQP